MMHPILWNMGNTDLFFVDKKLYKIPVVKSFIPSKDMCATEANLRYNDALLEELCGPFGKVMP